VLSRRDLGLDEVRLALLPVQQRHLADELPLGQLLNHESGLVAACHTEVNAVENQMLHGLTKHERVELRGLLLRCIAAIGEDAHDPR
jgi:hypothetical protein